MAELRLPYESLPRRLDGEFGGALHLTVEDFVVPALDLVSKDSGSGLKPNFVHVSDPRIGRGRTLTSVARSDAKVRTIVSDLASCGYFLYYSADGESRFVHRDRMPSLWSPVIDGAISVSDQGVYYTFETKESMQSISRLVVVFSGVANTPSMSSLYRYFEPNYRHLNGLTSADTGVLRIADVGGVVGAFYGATLDKPDNRLSISDLVKSFISRYNIDSDKVCLVGSSKGATGALVHGLGLRLPFVAVDPILSDVYYEEFMADAHFTHGSVFYEPKQKLIARITDSAFLSRRSYSAFLTSPNSEQYDLVTEFASLVDGPVGVYSASDPRIDGHAAVAGSTLGLTVSIVNSIIHQFPLREGVYEYC